MKNKKLNAVILLVAALFVCVFTAAGCAQASAAAKSGLDVEAPVVLKLIGRAEAWPAMENVISKFEKKYPNCTIVYENVQEYQDNLLNRITNTDDLVDIFETTNIQPSLEKTAEFIQYTVNLADYADKLDLSQTYSGLVDNFRQYDDPTKLYSIPFGGEMRGLYVNKTLLAECGLAVPTNRAELLNASAVLLERGYIPFDSGASTFAQQLLYPYICNLIVNGGNYEEMKASIENREPGISEYFRDPYSLIYEIVSKNYYNSHNSKRVHGFEYNSSTEKSKAFLNIFEDTKRDDIGMIAFMPDTQSMKKTLDTVKEDYHSAIEYEFIMSPVGVDGAYAYLSPSNGFAINNATKNLDWAIEFLDFFFKAENNVVFAAENGNIPNTIDALDAFDVPVDRVCDLGQVTFTFPFYRCVVTPMGEGSSEMFGISKMNYPDNLNADGSFKYTLDDYIARLETIFQESK